MKPVLTLLLTGQCLLSASSHAGGIPLDSMGQQFYSKTFEVEWKLPTNSLPAAVRTFKVVPAKFSQTLVSNLVSWGGFVESNRIRSSIDGKRIPHDVIVYRADDDRRALTVNPSMGLVDLYQPALSTEMPDGVPDKPRAYMLATNILRQLGFSTNEILLEDGKPRAWLREGTMTRYPKDGTQEPITRRSTMEVEFRRQLDGIYCILEYILIDFGSHERISRLEINWRGVRPSKPYPVASTGQMTDWIKEGRARVQSFSGPTDARYLKASYIKRITIVEFAPHYTAASRIVPGGEDEEVGRLYPYAVLQADAEIAPGDHETVWLNCPVISGGLNKPSQSATNDIGFSIYPSHPSEIQKKQGAGQ